MKLDRVNLMMKKRILKFVFISADKYPPFRVDISALFGDEFSSLGHKIEWILQSDDDCQFDHYTTWKGFRVWVVRTDNGQKALNKFRKYLFRTIFTLKQLLSLRITEFDFIQVKDRFLVALFASYVAHRAGKKFFYWLSYPFPEANIYRSKNINEKYSFLFFIRGVVYKVLLYKLILSKADHVFVQSDKMRHDIHGEGVPYEKMTTVPMGITDKDLQKANRELPVSKGEDDSVLLYLGTMLRVRELDFLLRVFQLVLKQRPNCKLYMVGGSENPKDLDFLIEEAARLGVNSKTVFTGSLPRDVALDYLQRAHVCLSPFVPSRILDSTSPTKLLEYLLFRKPVVANDHPEQRVIINESKSGYCVPYDEHKFSEAILKLVNNKKRSVLMGKRGQRYVVEKRNYTKIARELEGCYMKILGY